MLLLRLRTAGEREGIFGFRGFDSSLSMPINSLNSSGSVEVDACALDLALLSAPASLSSPASAPASLAGVAHARSTLMHDAHNSWSDTVVNSLRVQRSTSYNLQGVVAPNSRRKVRQGCTVGSRYAEQTVDMSPVPAAGTYRRSAGTVHAQRQVPRKRLAGSSGVGAGPGPGPGVGLVWLGVSWASLRLAWRFLARWWCHLGDINLHRNLWVGRGYVVPRIREFGC